MGVTCKTKTFEGRKSVSNNQHMEHDCPKEIWEQ